jgi:hypothetical protein
LNALRGAVSAWLVAIGTAAPVLVMVGWYALPPFDWSLVFALYLVAATAALVTFVGLVVVRRRAILGTRPSRRATTIVGLSVLAVTLSSIVIHRANPQLP